MKCISNLLIKAVIYCVIKICRKQWQFLLNRNDFTGIVARRLSKVFLYLETDL